MKRFNHTHILIQLFIIGIICDSLDAQQTPNCTDLDLLLDCGLDSEEIVWAIAVDDQQCVVLKNRCAFNFTQCMIFHSNETLLNESTKENCQKLCPNACKNAETDTDTAKEPVCAARNGNHCWFKDYCSLQKHICNKGEPWHIGLPRLCEEQQKLPTNYCPNS